MVHQILRHQVESFFRTYKSFQSSPLGFKLFLLAGFFSFGDFLELRIANLPANTPSFDLHMTIVNVVLSPVSFQDTSGNGGFVNKVDWRFRVRIEMPTNP